MALAAKFPTVWRMKLPARDVAGETEQAAEKARDWWLLGVIAVLLIAWMADVAALRRCFSPGVWFWTEFERHAAVPSSLGSRTKL